MRDRLKVLLISGEPHAGERAWRSLLKSDPSVDLVHITILRPPEKLDGTPINELSLAVAASGPLNPLELADLRSTSDKMQPLVNATGGRIFRLSEGRLPTSA